MGLKRGGGDQIRPGCRGGQDRFKWEQVRTDKDRERYLGFDSLVFLPFHLNHVFSHSIYAPVGRWCKGI